MTQDLRIRAVFIGFPVALLQNVFSCSLTSYEVRRLPLQLRKQKSLFTMLTCGLIFSRKMLKWLKVLSGNTKISGPEVSNVLWFKTVISIKSSFFSNVSPLPFAYLQLPLFVMVYPYKRNLSDNFEPACTHTSSLFLMKYSATNTDSFLVVYRSEVHCDHK